MKPSGSWRWGLLVGLVVTASGCGARNTSATVPAGTMQPAAAPSAPAPSSAPTRVYDLEPMRIEVVGTDAAGEPVLESFDARSLLDQGNDALAREQPEEAIAHYERLLAVFPDSSLAPAAAYNIGLAHEARGEHDKALARYRALAGDAALGRDGVEAHKRIGAVLAELQRWTEAREALESFLTRDDLTHSDRIEGMARLGYVVIEQRDYAVGELVLRDALDHYETLTVSLESNHFVAMGRYYLAQIPHRQLQAIPMRLPDEQLRRDLETKSQLLALAYDRYVEVLEVQDVYWATAAGYQMSAVYKELWDDIVLAPIPPQLSPEAAEHYVREVHEQVRVLLEKAMHGHLQNVELAEAYRTSTVWSDASREQADEIARLLARETGGELVRPERVHPRATPAMPSLAPGDYMPARVEL